MLLSLSLTLSLSHYLNKLSLPHLLPGAGTHAAGQTFTVRFHDKGLQIKHWMAVPNKRCIPEIKLRSGGLREGGSIDC